MPERKLAWHQLILINVYYLGLTSLAQTLTPLVLPLLVQEFVGEDSQGAYFGNLRLWTLIYEANRDKISSPSLIRVGMELLIPERD